MIVVESIACAIRADPKIDGFPLPITGKREKLPQYADDTSVLVCSDLAMVSLFSLFEKYERAPGAKLNQGKCYGLLLGTWKSRTDPPIKLRWTSEAILDLGTNISNNGQENWDKPIEKFKDMFRSWKKRNLTFKGSVTLNNIMGLSIFWYLASFSHVSNYHKPNFPIILFVHLV